VQVMRVEVVSLSHPVAPRSSEMTPIGDGRFTGGGVNFSVDGWWRTRVTIRRAGVAEDATGEIFLRTPDPNVAGFEETASTASDAAAEELYRRSREQFAAEPWVVQQEALSSSEGVSVVTSLAYADGVTTISSPGFDVIRAGGQRYTRRDGGAWTASKDAPVTGPDDWVTEFDGATNVELGIREGIDGVLCQVVTFYVPGSNLTPAFYALWVDVETGRIEQLAMDSVKHFMLKRYDWAAKPPPVVLPDV